ncbi:MAG: sigma-70 family RNA polymerase sigma factor [Gemmatimonadota bacterium]
MQTQNFGWGFVNFDQLFDDVYPRLHRYCTRMTADADVAEDAAQEAFVRLLHRDVTGDAAGVRAWLFKVATHLVRDGARVRNNRERLLRANPMDTVEDVTPELELVRKERIDAVRRALETLEDRDRTLLLLREEGLSYRELALAIDVKASSVGTLLARARRRLAGALNGEET